MSVGAIRLVCDQPHSGGWRILIGNTMAVPQNIREADTAAREAILKAITKQASQPTSSESLKNLAQAYNFVASTTATREPVKVQGF